MNSERELSAAVVCGRVSVSQRRSLGIHEHSMCQSTVPVAVPR